MASSLNTKLDFGLQEVYQKQGMYQNLRVALCIHNIAFQVSLSPTKASYSFSAPELHCQKTRASLLMSLKTT